MKVHFLFLGVKLMSTQKKFVNHGEVSDYEFLNSMIRDIRPHWEEQYLNTPNQSVKLRVDPKTGEPLWNMYWRNLVERQNIWHKRVVEGLPAPWTTDPVMSQYHFTNVDRRLDRVTLHYIDSVLEAFKKDYERANGGYAKEIANKFLILNTFIYRLFVRPETWEVIGYIYPDTAQEDWERGKNALREYKNNGNTVWTDAYYVNDLKSANPDKENSSDKLENAFWLFQYIIDNLDEIADYVFNPNNNMESVVEYLTRIPAVGLFTSYEVCLDLGTVKEFTGIDFVEWTPDHFPNIGPGCKKGIDYVFENRGGMTYEQIVFFTTAVARHELERLGLEYKFQKGADKLDLRCLEGWYCESQKYFNYYTTENGYDWAKGKRPKKKMKLRTDDTEWLKPRN